MVSLAIAGAAHSQPIDKSGYHLFNPTPRELWRDLSADRPDITESPRTVDAGAVQIEMSFIEWAKDGRDRRILAAPTNLKLGVLNNVDVQLVLEPYVRERSGGETNDGFGDTQLRVKINLWGNDDGDTAFAIMPFVKFPTAADDVGNDKYEGGVAFPFAAAITEYIELGLMLETGIVYDEERDNYGVDLLHTVALGIDLTDQWGLFIEGVGIARADSDMRYRALLAFGATYAVTPDFVLDAGVSLGLRGDVDDVVLFTGMTVRF